MKHTKFIVLGTVSEDGKPALRTDPHGNFTRIGHVLESIPERVKKCEIMIQDTLERLENAKDEVIKPFPQEEELNCLPSSLKRVKYHAQYGVNNQFS